MCLPYMSIMTNAAKNGPVCYPQKSYLLAICDMILPFWSYWLVALSMFAFALLATLSATKDVFDAAFAIAFWISSIEDACSFSLSTESIPSSPIVMPTAASSF